MNTAAHPVWGLRTSGLAAVVIFAVTVQPLAASSVVLHGFDPVKSWLLTVAVFALFGIAAWREELSGGWPSREWTARAARWCALAIAVSVTLGLAFADGDRWTAFLGGNARRQGWLTEITELGVFAAAVLAVSNSRIGVREIAFGVVLSGAGVSAAAICQSHWVFFLDPTPWSGEVHNRIAGVMGTASQLTTYLAVVFPVSVACLLDAIRRRDARTGFAVVVSLGLQAVAFLLARGRAGTVGAFAGVLLVLLGTPAVSSLARTLRLATVALLMSSAAFLLVLTIPGGPLASLTRGDSAVAHWLDRLSQLTNFESGSGRVRGVLAESMMRAISKRPEAWIVGFGPDLAWNALAPNDSEERKRIEGFLTTADRPHQFGAEKLMAGGIPYFLAWLGILTVSCARVAERSSPTPRQGLRGNARAAIAWGGSAAVFFGWLLVSRSPGFACAMGSLAAALLTLGFATFEALRLRRDRVPAVARSSETILLTGMAGAVVAHLIAGGFSVSMAPERTLVFVLTGCLLGARDASATTVQESRHAAQESSRAAPDAGLLFGTACCALIPFYAYHAFTWGDASRPVYAAVAVPVILWVVAAFLRRGPFVPFAVNAAGAIIGGLAILTTCVLVNGRDFERDPSRNAAMGAATPLLLAWIVGVFAWVALRRGAQRGTRVDTLDTASASAVKPGRGPSWRAPVGSALAAACALLAFWIATAEMRSDTVMLGAVQLNMRARRLDEWLTLHETDPTKREAGRAQAIEINEQALELVERAKAVGAPLRRFGCLAPIERVLESERP